MAELHSENLSKSAENRRLRRSIKKVTQELSSLQQERERLEEALEAARRERGGGEHAVHVSAAAGPLEWGRKPGGCVAGYGFREIDIHR